MALTTYTVKVGDNLTTIAAAFATTIAALQEANHIQNPDLIYIGQVLIIPKGDHPTDKIIRVIDNGVRLRSSPDFGDNIIILLSKDTRFHDASLKGDWWKVQYHGEDAYVHASMVEMVTEDGIGDGQTNTIIYRSQWDIDANNRVCDCGQTCVAMVASSRGVNVRINDLPYESAPNGLSSAYDLVNNFVYLNLDTARVVSLPMGAQAPANSICLMWYGGLKRSSVQDKNYTGWHWVVFLREEDNAVVVDDPNFWADRRDEGSEKHYSKAEWNAAFVPYGSSSCRTCVELI